MSILLIKGTEITLLSFNEYLFDFDVVSSTSAIVNILLRAAFLLVGERIPCALKDRYSSWLIAFTIEFFYLYLVKDKTIIFILLFCFYIQI